MVFKKKRGSISESLSVERGFTLIELILVMGIVVIIGVVASRDLTQQIAQGYFTNTVERIVRTLRTAQNYSFSGKEDSSWGVHYEQGKIVLFKGTSYASRDAAFDAETPIPVSVEISGWNDIYFDKLRGLPSATPSILVESFGRAGVISVGSEGVINRP
jgi:prepilin-type N-terminal cleavage/methylation domain-containing protein